MIKPHVRAIIAAAAISHATGKTLNSIYQYDQDSGYKSISMNVKANEVTRYDYTTSAHFSGTIPNLYHYGASAHVEFKPDGSGKYAGYDCGAGRHFEVKVQGQSASFYDYGGSGWTEFSA